MITFEVLGLCTTIVTCQVRGKKKPNKSPELQDRSSECHEISGLLWEDIRSSRADMAPPMGWITPTRPRDQSSDLKTRVFSHCTGLLNLSLFFQKICIYWPHWVSVVAYRIFGLCCGIQDLQSLLWHSGSFFICLFVSTCGIYFLDPGSNLGLLPWECRVLAAGPWGKSFKYLTLGENTTLLPFSLC